MLPTSPLHIPIFNISSQENKGGLMEKAILWFGEEFLRVEVYESVLNRNFGLVNCRAGAAIEMNVSPAGVCGNLWSVL